MDSNIFDLSGRIALISGAGGEGFGRSMAAGFARFGADVVCADVSLEGAEKNAELVRQEGGKALAVRCDVSSQEDVENMVAATVKEFGTIDVLVNSAGITKHVPPTEFDMVDWMRIIEVNLKGTFMCCRAAGRIMLKKGKGSIISISSILGSAGTGRGNSAYAASKGGIDALTRELAIEWAGSGIRVNAIAPCQFNPGVQAALDEFPDPDALKNRMLDNIPVGRIGEADEIVGSAVYLASDASSMVTGHIIHLDGGYLAR